MRGPGWPIARTGQKIGLLGGSFDPPHAGHLAVSHAALARFGLDRVWWLVSPGNPLKEDAPADLAHRLTAARALVRDPRVEVTAIEAAIRTRYTADTVAELSWRYAGARLVWLMGADNLAQFHRWDRWRDIAATCPVGVLARPGSRLAALRSPAARALGAHRVPPGLLAASDPPAWSFVTFPMRSDSSSALRAAGAWS